MSVNRVAEGVREARLDRDRSRVHRCRADWRNQGRKKLNFVESIKTCFSKYADFNGRASRPEFWWWALFTLLVSMALGFVSQMVSGLFSLAVLLPSIAVGARRLHDTDRTGWLQLVWLIPVIGWILMIYWCVQDAKEPNRFGSSGSS